MKKRYILMIALCTMLSLFVSCNGSVDEMLFGGDGTTTVPTDGTVAISEAGETITLGSKDGVNKITWRALKVDTKNKRALIISQDILELKAFDDTDRNTEDTAYDKLYKESDIRTYLQSEEFFKEYGLDKSYMLEVDVLSNINKTVIKENGGDYVFLLSNEETNAGASKEFYFADTPDRIAKYENEANDWWLRTENGYIKADGNFNNENGYTTQKGVRPAFWYTWE